MIDLWRAKYRPLKRFSSKLSLREVIILIVNTIRTNVKTSFTQFPLDKLNHRYSDGG